ncbi:hypothetical protein NHQ30_000395 [Ciborinia camelliae]|nr:hypothetical protein NHQ30_000395 [Ciborinia camelliae]
MSTPTPESTPESQNALPGISQITRKHRPPIPPADLALERQMAQSSRGNAAHTTHLAPTSGTSFNTSTHRRVTRSPTSHTPGRELRAPIVTESSYRVQINATQATQTTQATGKVSSNSTGRSNHHPQTTPSLHESSGITYLETFFSKFDQNIIQLSESAVAAASDTITRLQSVDEDPGLLKAQDMYDMGINGLLQIFRLVKDQRTTLVEAIDEVSNHARDLGVRDTELARSEKELEEAKRELADSRKCHDDEVRKLADWKKEFDGERKKLARESNNLEEEKLVLEEEKEILEEGKTGLRERLRDLGNKEKELRVKEEVLAKEGIGGILTKLDNFRDGWDSLTTKLIEEKTGRLESEKVNLQRQVEEKEDSYQNLVTAKSELDTAYSELEAQVSQLKTQVSQLESTRDQLVKDKETLASEYQATKEELVTLKQTSELGPNKRRKTYSTCYSLKDGLSPDLTTNQQWCKLVSSIFNPFYDFVIADGSDVEKILVTILGHMAQVEKMKLWSVFANGGRIGKDQWKCFAVTIETNAKTADRGKSDLTTCEWCEVTRRTTCIQIKPGADGFSIRAVTDFKRGDSGS